jgi:hypothetical protein
MNSPHDTGASVQRVALLDAKKPRGRAPARQAGLNSAWRSSEAGSLGRVSYGQPARGAGASVAATWPVRGSANMFSGPLHTVAIMNSVRPSSPQRTSEAPVVKLDHLQHLTAFADAYTALVGDVAVPDRAGGVVADAVGDAVSQVSPDTPVGEPAVGCDLESREPLRVRLGHDQCSVVRRHQHAVGEGEPVGHLTDGAIARRQGDDPSGELHAGHEVKATTVDVGVPATVDDKLIPRRGLRRRIQIGVGDKRPVVFTAQERPSRAETRSRSPSGSQSTQHGNAGARRITSRHPARSTVMTSGGPQSENHRRSWCQRGCSPKAIPVIKTWSSGCEDSLDGVTPSSVPPALDEDFAPLRPRGQMAHSMDWIDAGMLPESARPQT